MKPMGEAQSLETIWEIPDDLWEKVEPVILEGLPPKGSQGVSLDLLHFCQSHRSQAGQPKANP